LAWLVPSMASSTLMGVLSHQGAAASTSAAGMALTRQAGTWAVGVLTSELLLLTLIAVTFPAMRDVARRLGALNIGIVLTGMPWLFLCAIVAPMLGVTNFWGVAGFGGIVALVLWLRALTLAVRGAGVLWASGASA
jgi:hypothetical protein